MGVQLTGPKVKGIFLERPNRFEARVRIGENVEKVHVPNTGRMHEMLHPGVEVVVEESDSPKRKTRYSLKFVKKNGHWICIHSALANRVFEDAVKSGKVDWVDGPLRREVHVGGSRVDFLAEGVPPTLIEVKCATFEEQGVAKFPDAPTLRGRRHIEELIRAVDEGYRGAIVIVAFMDFVESFTPHSGIDPELAIRMKEADEKGIRISCYTCRIDFDEIELAHEIPVCLES